MVDLQLVRLTGQLESQGLGIEVKQSAKELLAELGYDPQLGGRPLRRAIQRHIEDSLSEKILYKEFSAGEIIVVDTEEDPEREGKKKFTFTAVEGFVPPASVELEMTATEKPAAPPEAQLPPPEAAE
jgi:ATP-dependent Clp protease ATP-binding subunit ClpC